MRAATNLQQLARDSIKKRVGNYYLGRTLGEGAYAKVKYGLHAHTGETVAIKVLEKDRLVKLDLVDQLKREITIMRHLHHPNVVDLKEVMATKDKVYVVMELVPGGQLFDRIVANGPMKCPHHVTPQEHEGRRIFQQLMDALDHCHRRGVFHRDLKPENVLLTEDGTAKLSDFGLGTLAAARQTDMLTTTCGTPNYVAPEVLMREGYQGAPADVWSLGVVLFVLLAGRLPFDEPSLPALFGKTSRGDYSVPPWFSNPLRNLLALMLQPDPAKRATIAQLRDHPWVRCDYLEQASASRHRPLDVPMVSELLADDSYRSLFNENAEKQPVSQLERISAVPPARLPINAFQLMNSALDMSALFEARPDTVMRHTRFTSKAPPDDIITVLEAATAALRGRVHRRLDLHRVRLVWKGQYGTVVATAEVLTVVPGTHMVEVRRNRGDVRDFHAFYARLVSERPLAALVSKGAQSAAAPPAGPSSG